LDAEIDKHPQLDARDRGLATELVYGTVRCYPALLKALRSHAPRGLPEDDWAFIVPLVIAAYQVLYLDRVPAFAAVDAAVGQISRVRGKPLGGFANAVLRKLGRSVHSQEQAVFESAPPWLTQALRSAVGERETRALLGISDSGGFAPGFLGLRYKTGQLPSQEIANAEPSPLLDGAYRVRRAGDPRRLAGYQAGHFSVQEEGAQFVAAALGAKSGERVLDACAGRGQKTMLLAERVGAGVVWASDLYPAKLAALAEEARRLQLPEIRTRALDLTQGVGDLPGDFDRVLVDAPCSGTGTLRRRPEILLRLRPEDPTRLAQLAEKILRTVCPLVRPGGRLVFAVCSVLPEECEAVVARVSDILAPIAFDSPEVTRVFGANTTSFRLLPGAHGTDGYFAASLCRVAAR